jgi:aminoglycoside N3'-acetyltransferase
VAASHTICSPMRPGTTTTRPDSPLDRLCRLGGHVLGIGANPDTATVVHFAEYLAAVPDKGGVRRYYRCRGAEGPETRTVECLDDEHGTVDEDYFAVILRHYLATGRAKCGRVGGASSERIEAADLANFGLRLMSEHLNRPATKTAAK